jgi:hypothetical protein
METHFAEIWNNKHLGMFPSHWGVKQIDIYSKMPVIPFDEIIATMQSKYDIVEQICNADGLVSIIASNIPNNKITEPRGKRYGDNIWIVFSNLYGETYYDDTRVSITNVFEVNYYGVFMLGGANSHNAVEKGYCDERENYVTSQIHNINTVAIHEQQNDFTNYNPSVTWKPIDYIFADAVCVSNICKY